MFWTTKEGQIYSIDGREEGYPKMTDSHLTNVINKLYQIGDIKLSKLIKDSYYPESEEYDNYLSKLKTQTFEEMVDEYLENKITNFKYLLIELKSRNLQIEFKFIKLEQTKTKALMAEDYDLSGEEHPFGNWDYDVWESSYMGGD